MYEINLPKQAFWVTRFIDVIFVAAYQQKRLVRTEMPSPLKNRQEHPRRSHVAALLDNQIVVTNGTVDLQQSFVLEVIGHER